MPSAVTLPTFSRREKLLYTKLNSAMAAIQARFTAGLGGADIAWPLTAEGNLDMSSYNIVNGRQIWGYVNASSYTTFAAAVAAAGAGGVVVVPPDTTIVSDGGVDYSNLGAIIGSGPSSVLKLSASASATELLKATAGTYIMLSNLTLDGNSVASKLGVDLQGVSQCVLNNVWLKNFGGAAVKVSNSCDGVYLNNVWFSGGAGKHLHVTHSGYLGLVNVVSSSAAGIAIDLEAAGASSYIYAGLNNVQVTGCASTAIKALGVAAPGTANPIEVYGTDVRVTANSGGVDAVILGTASAALHHVTWTGGSITGAAAGGILVNASDGNIGGVTVNDPATYCVDLDVSKYVSVHDCVLRAGTIGVDGSGCTAECRAQDNIIESCTTGIVHGPYLYASGNTGTVDAEGTTAWAYTTSITIPETDSATDRITFTIPANTLKVGSILVAELWLTGPGVGYSTDGVTFKLNGQSLGSVAGTTLGSQSSGYGKCTLVITGTTTARRYSIHSYGSANVVGAADVTGLDITAAQSFVLRSDFSSSSGADAVLHGATLHIYKS